VRTLTNPKLEPRGSAARTPHHLLNGTIAPNGLHFVIARGGFPDIDPDKHKLLIHGHVRQPMTFTVEASAALADDIARNLPRVRRQQRAALFQGPDPG
jgi:sulfane dehydrogenase subunit SoxC